MDEKIWVEKDGYIAFRDGSIFRLNWHNTGKCVEVKQSEDRDGYLMFCRNGKRVFAHRFIAECFISNPQNLPCINHKNEIKSDNRVENLEYCDHKYNNNYGTRNKRAGESISKKVLQFTKDGEFVKEWCSLSEINRVCGYNIGCISNCCKGKRKSSGGFLWRYK